LPNVSGKQFVDCASEVPHAYTLETATDNFGPQKPLVDNGFSLNLVTAVTYSSVTKLE
jgi:hypothetical protein